MHLCSDPSLGNHDDGFNGRLLELAIWDEGLSPKTIRTFYQQVQTMYILGTSGSQVDACQ